MQAIVLNSSYEFLQVTGYKNAIKNLSLGKAEVVAYVDKIKGIVSKASNELSPYVKKLIEYGKYVIVIRIIKMVRIIMRRQVRWSKYNVLIRDNFTCQYCNAKIGDTRNGIKITKQTIDHIIPISRGGESTFENTVCCCPICNRKKGNKLPSEIRMYPFKGSYKQPTIQEFFHLKMKIMGIDKVLKDIGVY